MQNWRSVSIIKIKHCRRIQHSAFFRVTNANVVAIEARVGGLEASYVDQIEAQRSGDDLTAGINLIPSDASLSR